MTIQLLNKEDLTLDDSYASESKMLKSWIASYSLTSPTEGIGAHVDAPLLSRNRNLEEEVIEDGDFDIVNRMEAKVVNETYKLLFVANTE